MIRLTKTAWNNIIIFAMLLMILLFNTTSNILNTPSDMPDEVSLLPQGSVLMTLQSNGVQLERIGTGWRVDSEDASIQAQIDPLLTHWTSSIMTPTERPESLPAGQVVVLWLAGESKGLVYSLYPFEQGTLVEFEQRFYTLAESTPDKFVFVSEQVE
jgi:uncharacterized protein YbdZ (MbtH family)